VWGRVAPSADHQRALPPGAGPVLTAHVPWLSGARTNSNRGPDQPAELLAHHDRGQPWYQWGCPLPGCDWWVILPWDLEAHAAADHPGWAARYELVRPLPRQYERVVFRRIEEPPTS
jgi:hypothetical protein